MRPTGGNQALVAAFIDALNALRVSVVGALPVQTPNTSGLVVNLTATVTPQSVVPPVNAVGFILTSDSIGNRNIRWAIGATAGASVGTLAEPGRDTGFVPCAATISVVSLTGTQNLAIQWVLST